MTRATLRLRPACLEDARRLFEWRNDPAARAASLETGELDWQVHQLWLARSLARTDRLLMIGVATRVDEPVGLVRFDETRPGGPWEVSINIAPHLRGRGWGAKLLQAGLDHMGEELDFIARIRSDNLHSQRLFEGAGFVRAGLVGGVLAYGRARRAVA